MVSERFLATESQGVRNEDEWCEIQDSDLCDFLDDVRTDEITDTSTVPNRTNDGTASQLYFYPWWVI